MRRPTPRSHRSSARRRWLRRPDPALSRARPLPQVQHRFQGLRPTCGSGQAREGPSTGLKPYSIPMWKVPDTPDQSSP
ncbi:DUF2384 domain-containing protein [Pseudomonas sp. PCH44]|nr:DUF2384 domain-containing protein [Stenotrophomonas rhizophila]MBS3187999.1 DUF2384 domain-containing protein [Pseudomonas sp. PCH44]